MNRVNAGRRAIAVAIDVVVTTLCWLPFARIQHGPGALRLSWFGWRAVIPVVITIAYFALLPVFAGATAGMLAMRVRTVVVPADRRESAGSSLSGMTADARAYRPPGAGSLPPPPAGIPPPI